MTRFGFVEAEKALLPVALLCRLLKVIRAGSYAWGHRPPSARAVADEVLTLQIETIFEADRRVYGASRVHVELTELRPTRTPTVRRAEIVGCHRLKRSFSITKQNPSPQQRSGQHVQRRGLLR